MKSTLFLISCIMLLYAGLCTGQKETELYSIVSGGWDYLIVDEKTGRLFVSHGMVTQVVDSHSGKLLGTIPDTKGVHGIALAEEEGEVFISCGIDSSVSIVSLASLQLISKIKVTGANPDAILYDSFSHKVFVYNGRTDNATVIDAKANKVIATISLAGKPEFSVSDGHGNVYVNIEDKSMITVINSATLKVENSWTTSPGEEPSGLALDNETHRLFSVCGNKKMVVMDAINGKVITTLDIGGRVDGCAFDPELKRVYSSNGEGTLTVVQKKDKDKYYILTTVRTQKGARTICLDSRTHHVFLPAAEYGETPAPTADHPHPRAATVTGTFKILDIAPRS